MLVKEQRGKRCPEGNKFCVGSVACEECDNWKQVPNGGILDEYCQLLKEAVA